MAVFLVVPFVAMRSYVLLHVRYYAAVCLKPLATDDEEEQRRRWDAEASLAAYPEEAMEVLVEQLDPADPVRCSRLESMMMDVACDWWERSGRDRRLARLMCARLDFIDPGDPPAVLKRKCDGLREWWSRCRP